MNRSKVTSLASNADAAALETARAALTAASGIAVLAGGRADFTIAAAGAGSATPETLQSGDMVGFARMPATTNADGSIATWLWSRWAGGDFAIVAGAIQQVSPVVEVPPGATRIISLPLAVVDSGGSSSFNCGINFTALATR